MKRIEQSIDGVVWTILNEWDDDVHDRNWKAHMAWVVTAKPRQYYRVVHMSDDTHRVACPACGAVRNTEYQYCQNNWHIIESVVAKTLDIIKDV